MLMQQHYKHKTILKATKKPEVTIQSLCLRLPESKNSTLSWITFISAIWCCWEDDKIALSVIRLKRAIGYLPILYPYYYCEIRQESIHNNDSIWFYIKHATVSDVVLHQTWYSITHGTVSDWDCIRYIIRLGTTSHAYVVLVLYLTWYASDVVQERSCIRCGTATGL